MFDTAKPSAKNRRLCPFFPIRCRFGDKHSLGCRTANKEEPHGPTTEA
jgi:hypothetical protein